MGTRYQMRQRLLSIGDEMPLPEGVTAHRVRHAIASILYVRGEEPPHVMAQLGHADAGFTLRVYAQTLARKRLKTTKPPRMQGLQRMGAAGFEPATSRV